jgi:thiol-disulfide isomerase/thioredoxin
MKLKLALLTVIIGLGIDSSAQINWVHDENTARLLAFSENKLIVMDFWAVWCGPCRTMDKTMWSKVEMAEISKNFIALKVDVDRDRALAMKYSASSIPKIVIINAAGEKIWEKVGYSGPSTYMPILSSIPEDVSVLNKLLLKRIEDPDAKPDYLALGMAYQQMTRTMETNALFYNFLNQSDSHFNKAIKKGENPALVEQAVLLKILNDAYRDKPKKVFKQLGKLKINSEQNDLMELKHFILAYCYKCNGELDKMEVEKKEITNVGFLAELEE